MEAEKTGNGGVMSTVTSGTYHEQEKKKGNRNYSIPLDYLVAGPGFEPGTFGLWGAKNST
jgi:hypothetical protein